jgi:hypothetical protein
VGHGRSLVGSRGDLRWRRLVHHEKPVPGRPEDYTMTFEEGIRELFRRVGDRCPPVKPASRGGGEYLVG